MAATLALSAGDDIDALGLAGTVGSWRENEIDVLNVRVMVLDRIATALIQAAGVVDGDTQAAIVVAVGGQSVVIAVKQKRNQGAYHSWSSQNCA